MNSIAYHTNTYLVNMVKLVINMAREVMYRVGMYYLLQVHKGPYKSRSHGWGIKDMQGACE